MSSIMVELDCIYSGNNVTVFQSVQFFLQRGRYSLVILVLVFSCGFT